MTFLEYVLRKLVGPPQGNYFPCPFREHSNPYQVVVNKPAIDAAGTGRQFAVKGRCHRACGPGPRGCFDEFDVVQAVRPDMLYPERVALVAKLRAEWQAGLSAPGKARTGILFSPTGRQRDDPHRIPVAWANLMDDLRRAGVDTGEEVYMLVKRYYDAGYFQDDGWDRKEMSEVLIYWRDSLDWCAESDRLHLQGCDDHECDAIVCRAARGLPPLTTEQIEASRPRREGRIGSGGRT